ncbi:hypothetical protein PENTCL1PPCAC_27296, partial [Pristionchus entomophagus]
VMHFHTVLGLVFCVSFVSADTLPEGYFGKFALDHSDNFDEYLKATGLGWFKRRLVSLAGVEKVFTKAGPNSFDFDNLTTKKDLHYKNVVLGKEFIGEGLDSSKQKITFSMRGGHLYEKHVPTDPNAEQKEDEYSFKLDGDTLVQTLQANGVVAKRYYKRQ